MAQSETEFIAALNNYIPDLILSDHSLPGFNSTEAYKISVIKRPGTPFILLTGTVSEQFAVDCLQAGIDDYILKTNLIRLPSSILRILSKQKIKQEKEIIETLLEELKTTYKQIELKNREITDSINYARRIQDAVLPNTTSINNEFKDGFIIYEPRNIVSGDLYWLANTTTTNGSNLSLKIIAAIDCTGHGIPGAFMSLLTSVILNQTLKNTEINSPADVLIHLNQNLPALLNRNHKEKITDGLDIALCAIDLQNRTLYFSGANRPVWIIRKHETENFELIEHKGTKASIGSHTPVTQLFANNKINLETGDRLFLFTDGITDQFGGANGKKMGRKKLKEILLNSSHLSMKLQKEYIAHFLKEWKGLQEQVDDILLLGIEMD